MWYSPAQSLLGGAFVCLPLRPVPVPRVSCPYAHRAVSTQVCVDRDISGHHRTEKVQCLEQGCFPTPLKYTLPNDGGWDWLRDILIPNLDCLCAGLEFLPAPQYLPPHHPLFPAVWGGCRVPWGVRELPRQNLAPHPTTASPKHLHQPFRGSQVSERSALFLVHHRASPLCKGSPLPECSRPLWDGDLRSCCG